MGFAAPSLKGKALQWLAQREHSRAELQAKLLRHAVNMQRKAVMGKDGKLASVGRLGSSGMAAIGDEADTAETAAAALALTQSQITQVLDDLGAAGLQSDARTAQSVARSKSSRYGVHRIKQQLQAKGLASELVARTVGEVRDTEFDRALDVWRRRYGEPAQNMAERARQVRFLTARGFDSEVVRRVVRGAVEVD